ncbi:MAG TPA: MarR family transcriptional regulator [Anaerolineales bacterium]|nr:MarR family transcriptional regulator [Anaerolineales bacterium]
MDEPEKTSSGDLMVGDVIDLLRDLLHGVLISSLPAWLELQLTLPQLRTLFIIAHNKTSSVMQIAQHLGIGDPTASHLIDKLVQARLVERSEDPADRRRAIIQLSPEGEELIGKLLGWEEFLVGRLHNLPEEDLGLFRQGLAAIVREIQK